MEQGKHVHPNNNWGNMWLPSFQDYTIGIFVHINGVGKRAYYCSPQTRT